MTDVAALLALARSRRLTLATAESCTGGLVAATLTDVAGSSVVFLGGYVTYSNALKVSALGVSEATLAQFGAVSEQVAREMALGALSRTGADVAISVTGIAGPGGSDAKPEGRVCFGLAHLGKRRVPTVAAETVDFGAPGRAAVRRAATDHALALLAQLIDSVSPNR